MKNQLLTLLSITLVITSSCKKKVSPPVETSKDTKTKTIKLFAQSRPGGEPFDFDMPIDLGLDKLEFIDPDNVEIDSTDLIIGIALKDIELAVPLTYLSGFEVANLFLESNNYLVTWCPLVGTARIFEGNINGDNQGFDFGRGLVDNNLLIVDRKTQSVWNQLSCKAIKGKLKGDNLNPLPTVQSTWSFWKKKYPNTKLLINKDTTNAVFPSLVFQKQFYNTWEPGQPYPENNEHLTDNLGLGIQVGTSSTFFSFDTLFEMDSPHEYYIENKKILVYSNKSGLTAWAEDEEGNMIPGAIVYDWAWQKFYPRTENY